ncbi:KAP family P-loop NTPase fold protein [Stenotrophomonas maltophilia]|uniref:KAP family P-loop NTPase fold protein n=1 Tax=Stenotrophomonas maltophilia TaxID=40324 RepID=UPI000C26254B|nr:P-loop NTPase fold protein [Stenotrophomonas maltophilia]PJL58469.1 hypothetical protein B9Y82_06910 [Stenotrophomonas maltophilia]
MNEAMCAISPDEALTGAAAIEKDKLQRTGFAAAATRALDRVSSTAGFVISIEGPWGSGKTSTLAMMEHLIRSSADASPIVVHFNPWLIGDRESLLRQFLGSISSAIELVDNVSGAKKVAKEIQNYSKVFDLLKWVPGAEPWASIVKGVMESAGKAAGGFADQKERDISGQKERLEKALSKFKRKIFVFIDDVDRLFPLEVFEMVRIVKAVGQLPNIGYVIAWDSEYVRRALRSASVPRASTYIDKVVQVRLPLPAISPSSRLRLLNDAISSLPDDALMTHFPKQEERMNMLYFNGLRDLLEQPRDITRVINTVSVIEPGLRGEVVFADIVGLACLIVRAPRVYDELRRDSSLFTKIFDGSYSGGERDAHASRLEELYRRTQNPEAVRKLVHFLFPSTAAAANKYAFGRQVDIEGHISAPSRLGIALGMSIGLTDVSIVDAKRFILSAERRLEVAGKINEDNGLGFLEMLEGVAEIMSVEEVKSPEDSCMAIARLVDGGVFSTSKTERKFFSLSAETLAVRAISRLVSTCMPGSLCEMAYKIATDPNSLTVAAEILTNGLRTEQEPNALIVVKQKRKLAGEVFAENSRVAVLNGTFWGFSDPARILWTIMRVAPKIAASVFSEIKKDDPTLDKFALNFLRHGLSSSGGRSYAVPEDPTVANLVSLSELAKHAKRRLDDPQVSYPLRAAWQSVVDGRPLYGKDGSVAKM